MENEGKEPPLRIMDSYPDVQSLGDNTPTYLPTPHPHKTMRLSLNYPTEYISQISFSI